jgi:hypothetical protein
MTEKMGDEVVLTVNDEECLGFSSLGTLGKVVGADEARVVLDRIKEFERSKARVMGLLIGSANSE